MDRRTYLKSADTGGVTLMMHSETLKALDSNLPWADGKSAEKTAMRLPKNLVDLVGNSELLKKLDNLVIACCTFLNYHFSAFHNRIYGLGWTEYNLVRNAPPWFWGHEQSGGPLLGELDESLPRTWEKYNELYLQSGMDVLIWYWYSHQPCLHETLENGFLQSSNRNSVKFACMWTNHPWYVLYPTTITNGRNAYPPSYPPVDESLVACWRSLSYLISRYCHLDNYWKIEVKLVICIWDPNRLEKQIGVSGVKRLFTDLREFAIKLGHKGLHFHSSGFYFPNSEEVGYNTADSYTPFAWVADHYQLQNVEFPDYGIAAADVAFKLWPKYRQDFAIPYLLSLSSGWDSAPKYT